VSRRAAQVRLEIPGRLVAAAILLEGSTDDAIELAGHLELTCDGRGLRFRIASNGGRLTGDARCPVAIS
jgi:hypothetical protein